MAIGTEFSAGVAKSGNRVSAQFRSGILGAAADLAEGSIRGFSGFVSSLVIGKSIRREKLRDDMLASRAAATAQEKFALLNCRRLPARLNTSETALVLGFQDHNIAPLVAAKLLLPLGKPASNAPKYFAAVEIVELAADPRWLADATKTLGKHWQRKNQRKQMKPTLLG